MNKTKFMIFHKHNKVLRIPNIIFDNTPIQHVNSFNFLGLHLDSNMLWNTHINSIASKVTRSIGVINRIKHYVPLNIRKLLYESLILSHMNYGILLWGFRNQRITKLQKSAVRIITLNKYNAHTEHIFKSLNILKLDDIFKLNQLKFYHKMINSKLPHYFIKFHLIENRQVHRISNCLRTEKVYHSFSTKCIRFSFPSLINNTETCIVEKVHTHSLNGFATYIKKRLIDN